jgi:uncharacterized protein YjdB|tara:strand:+ start:1881 stop:2180 length:300 start_codon:yes stop_codon:yes gene_type:complete
MSETKKRAVRHQTPEWNRITLRVDTSNKDYLEVICKKLNISQNLLLNKIIDVFRGLDSEGKSIGITMISNSLKKDSDKYDVTQVDTIEKTIQILKENLL